MKRRQRKSSKSKVALCYRIPGYEGGIGMVKIPRNQTVVDLLKMIKAKNPTFLQFIEPEQLTLFLAKLDGEWMPIRGPEVNAMYSGDIPERVAQILTDPAKMLAPEQKIGDLFPDVHISDMEVHFLVKLPPTLPPPDPLEELPWRLGLNETRCGGELERYRAVGQRLKNHPDVQRMEAAIAKITESDAFPTPFVVLETSTGTGRTQMAFNLEASGRFDVFYVLASALQEVEQAIYKAFYDRCVAFIGCLEQDFLRLEAGSIRVLREFENLHLYGFVAAALRGEDRFTSPASRSDVEEALQQRQREGAKPCVFFLDKFPCVDDGFTDSGVGDLPLRYRCMSNVFRSFGLPVVISSSSEAPRQCISQGDRFQGVDSESSLCCVLVTSLPPADMDDEISSMKLPKETQRIIKHSRPWFAEEALNFLRSGQFSGGDWVESLSGLVKFLAPKLRRVKNCRPHEFAVGQLALLLGGTCAAIDESMSLVDGHYARIRDNGTLELARTEEGVLLHDGSPYVCHFSFSEPERDMLLHLTLLSGEDGQDDFKFQSLPAPVDQLLRDKDVQKGLGLKCTRDQLDLMILVASVILASRKGGVRGVTLPKFLGGLVYNLCIRATSEAVELPCDVKNFEVDQLLIPFLSSLDAQWPLWFLKDMDRGGVKFANLIRIENAGDIDVSDSSGTISVACKQQCEVADFAGLKEILATAPPKAVIHFVAVKKLDSSIFESHETADSLLCEDPAFTGIYSVSRRSAKEYFSRAAGDRIKCVIFIECGE